MDHLKPGAKRATVIISVLWVGVCLAAEPRVVDTQEEWQKVMADSQAMELADGLLLPQAGEAFVSVTFPTNGKKQALKSVTLRQFPVWDSWKGIPRVVPGGVNDAPVLLAVEPGNYWIVHPKVMHSTDMVQWKEIAGMVRPCTTDAEYHDGKFYLYYDKPNDRDAWVYITDDLSVKNAGQDHLVLQKPYLGGDAAIFRNEDGLWHMIYENYEPGEHGGTWDTALAGHSVSPDGIHGFEPDAHVPPIDTRGEPTGKTGLLRLHPTQYTPEEKKAMEAAPHEKFKKHIHIEHDLYDGPKDFYGDYTLIKVGRWYYLFCDYHADRGDRDKWENGKPKSMRVGRWRTDDITKPFVWCGEVGRNVHPDPTIAFAEGRFYLLVQNWEHDPDNPDVDYVSDGPWVDGVEVRAGVDVNNDGKIDEWTPFTRIKETYRQKPGFTKIVDVTPASLDTSSLPAGYAFQIEFKTTAINGVQPIIEAMEAVFE